MIDHLADLPRVFACNGSLKVAFSFRRSRALGRLACEVEGVRGGGGEVIGFEDTFYYSKGD